MPTLTPQRIEALADAALRKHGASELQARALAAGIAAAERDGLVSHGLMYLPTYCEHLTCGKVLGAAEPVLSQPAPAAPRGRRAQRLRPRGDRTRLVAPAGACAFAGRRRVWPIRNSYNCGALGYHTERLASLGLRRARLHQCAGLDRALGRDETGAGHESLVARRPRTAPAARDLSSTRAPASSPRAR